MRVVAATFADDATAQRVLAELRERFELRPIDADVAPLGAAGSENAASVVLAGRFRDSVVGEVEQLITHGGGAVVAEVDEAKAEHPAYTAEEAESWTW